MSVDSAWGGVVRIFPDCHGFNCELPLVPSPSCGDQKTGLVLNDPASLMRLLSAKPSCIPH